MQVAVLSIDGGGMKGIISSIVLAKLEKYLQEYSSDSKSSLTDYFDLVAGTSTGSILTALLLCPGEQGMPKYSPEDALELYLTKGKEMFRKRAFYPVNTLFGLFNSKYTNKYFSQELRNYFGELKMSELRKPSLIVSYDMKTRKTLFINSESCSKNEKRDMDVADAVLASCSAPTYFPPVCSRKYGDCVDCLIDGGVSANNPAMSAMVEALKMPAVNEIKDVYVLSVGNIASPKTYSYKEAKNWGLIDYAVPIIDIIMESSEEIVDYQMKKIYENLNAPGQYQRIEARTTGKIPAMDDTSAKALERFVEIGHELANDYDEELKKCAKYLIEIRKMRKM